MRPRHQVSRAGVVLIKRFEGLRTRAAQLEDGGWTLGYGHTKTAREGAVVSEADAEALLLYDLINVAHAVNEWVYAPLNQNQFDALVSFAFNIGLENFRRSTTLRRMNEGRPLEAALAMELWRRADFEGERIVVDALVRRRAYEKTLFLKPVEGFAPAPSPVLPPKLDYDAGALTPSSTPQVLSARLEGDRAIADRSQRMLPLEDAGPSDSERAAAAVTSRLASLLPEADFAPLGSPVEERQTTALSKPEAAAPAEQRALEHRDEAPRTIDVQTADERAAAPVPEPQADEEPWTPSPKPAPPKSDWLSLVLIFGLGVAGLVLVYSAVKWGFQPPIVGPSSLPLRALGWAAGGLGIACLAGAAYLFLSRLIERD